MKWRPPVAAIFLTEPKDSRAGVFAASLVLGGVSVSKIECCNLIRGEGRVTDVAFTEAVLCRAGERERRAP